MKNYLKGLLVVKLSLLSFLISYAPKSFISPEMTYNNYMEQREIENGKERNHLFLEALGMKESSNNWKVVNKWGYMGKWQMGRSALRSMGIYNITPYKFRRDPSIFSKIQQEAAIERLVNLNYFQLKRFIDVFSGATIKGVKITPAGILAAAHLGGVHGVEKFLYTQGRYNPHDALGTSILSYIKYFGNYNIYTNGGEVLF